MAYDVTATFSEEQIKISGTEPIQMYVLNASFTGIDYNYFVSYNQDVVGYSLNATGEVENATQLYTGIPINAGGLSSNIEGEIEGVEISIPNVDRSIEDTIQENYYLRGCEVYVLSAFAKHLPTGSNYKHIGSDEDYRSILKEKFFVDSVSSDENAITFSCKSKFSIKNITIPGRTFSHECQWDYNSSACNVSATMFSSYPTCDKTLSSCRRRDNQKRFGGFPSIPRKGYIILQ